MKCLRSLRILILGLTWCSLGLVLSASSCTNNTVTVENASICDWNATSRLAFAQKAVKNHPGASLLDAQQYLAERCQEEWRRYPKHDGTRNSACGAGGCDTPAP
jgi:hypothetical protein